MQYEIAIGKTKQLLTVPDAMATQCLLPNKISYDETGEAEIRRSLNAPIGAPLLGEVVKSGEKIVLITSDITRPVPSYIILPPILEALYAAGVKSEDITIVFGMGIHRRHTEAEQRKLVGDEIFDTVKCVDSNACEYIRRGFTSRGTPIDVSEPVANADRKICIGNVEYHYFAGYSGGAKAIMPGVSSHDAIQNNHKLMVQSTACAGKIEGNPLRADIEEAGAVCGVDYIVNVVLDEHKKIIHCASGDVTLAHREACAFLDRLYQKPLTELADIVVVSQGGAPKDLNLYQTQKALDNAKHAVKNGGTIILVGSCAEGFGEDIFEQWLLEATKPSDLTDRIAKDFQLGGHKAAAIAMVLATANISLVSEMDDDFAKKTFMTPFSTVQEAFDCALEKHGHEASIVVMPYGGSTLPKYKK